MKVLFVEARKNPEGRIPCLKADLPQNLHILYTIQYKKTAEELKKFLEKEHEILAFEQIIGCSKVSPKASLLLIGSGRFHALQIALSTGKEVFVYESGLINKISQEEIEKLKIQENVNIKKFLYSKNIGLLVSTKPGQKNLEQTMKFKRKFPQKDFYIFISDNINTAELENFPIDAWINFACPGIQHDNKNIINYEKILKIKK